MKIVLIIVTILLMGCTVEDLRTEDVYVKVQLDSIYNATPEQEQRVIIAVEKIEQALNSKEFYFKLMDTDLTSTNGLSNHQVYETIMNGKEIANPTIDNVINLKIQFYYVEQGISRGVHSAETNTVFLHSKFYGDNANIANMSKTIIHEWLHNVGYGHPNPWDMTTVPKAVGAIVRTIIM